MGKIIIYQNKDSQTDLEVKLEDEILLLSKKQMVELFSVTIATAKE